MRIGFFGVIVFTWSKHRASVVTFTGVSSILHAFEAKTEAGALVFSSV